MASVDFRKEYDLLAHNWIIEALKMFDIANSFELTDVIKRTTVEK